MSKIATTQDDDSYVFKGNNIRITRAPEPSDINWLNCEKKNSYKRIDAHLSSLGYCTRSEAKKFLSNCCAYITSNNLPSRLNRGSLLTVDCELNSFQP